MTTVSTSPTENSTSPEAARDARRAALRTTVRVAARILPTHYPLRTFIAVNPLAELQTLPFDQAIHRAADIYGIRGTLTESTFRRLHSQGRITDDDLNRALTTRYPSVTDHPALRLGSRTVSAVELLRADLLHGTGTGDPMRRRHTLSEQIDPAVAAAVDAQAAKWCAAFFGSARWPMPGRDAGFYSAWRALAPTDRTLPSAVRAELRAVAERPEDAVIDALDTLGIGPETYTVYLQAHLTRLPGWAAHIRWCGDHDAGIDPVAYLAVRLTYEAALLTVQARPQVNDAVRPTLPTPRERAAHLAAVWNLTSVTDTELDGAAQVLAALPVSAREMPWQNAFESRYRDALLAELDNPSSRPAQPALTQIVTCIDTRSEGLRRHLEHRGSYDTYGFAGFFAVAIRYTDLLGGISADLCPVLITPGHDVAEIPVPDGESSAARRIAGCERLARAEEAFHAAKDALAAPFALAEATGWAAAPLSAAKTLTPSLSGAARDRLLALAAPPAPSALAIDAISLDDRVLFGQVMLTTIGLTRHFGRLVVLCAHGSTTENNPYQASLDCGACGGQSGGPNARTAAQILNQPDVRTQLRASGIDIPEHTVFVAAQHDTATDRVTVLDTHLVPDTHRPDLARLQADLADAGAALAAERCRELPGAPRRTPARKAARHVITRSADWAQVYPEWALVNNAAFIVAPRAVTRGIDLQRRAFLHSYDPDLDPDGTALETIMTAPLVVAQWINSQYYFSTVAPEVFGAGTKTLHNVVGTVGVLTGHVGDLRLGLPWQSIADHTGLRHEPQRLLTVIQAPLARIDTVIGRNPLLQQLFGNDWLALAAREHHRRPWRRWTRDGWRPWSAPGHTPARQTDKEIPA